MNMQIRDPNAMISNALREVAMIAELKTTALGLARTDKKASSTVNQAHKAASNAGRVTVNRLAGADDDHRILTGLQEQLRLNLAGFTTAWGTSGRRLFPNVNFEPWIREHARLQGEFDNAYAEYKAKAPQLVQKATTALGDYDIEPPSVDEICNAYSVKYNLEPLPDGTQFAGLPGAASDFLKAQFEANIKAAYQEAQIDALGRLAKPLEALVERIGAYDDREAMIAKGDDPGRTGIFRDTLVSNIQDIASVFKSFNLLGDPTLDALANRLKIFMNATPEDLRKNGDLRASAKQQAEALIADLHDMLVPIRR